jgi:transcriptional regulator with XRE-family HTH domain
MPATTTEPPESRDEGRALGQSALDRQALSHVVGARLKRLRLQQRLTLQEVAAAVDLSHSFLSMVERGRADVSMARLHRLASFYSTPLSELVSEELEDGKVHVIGASDGQKVERVAGMTLRLLPVARELGLQVVHATFAPGAGPSTPVSHDGDDFFWVLSGKLVLAYGADEYLVRQGEAALYSGRVHHYFVNRTKRVAEILSITTPPYARIAAFAEGRS